ncbi:hypothetical protein M9Y10_011730 [Tritrichomonas musculus]|uniref:Leucine-rich repeat domain-containing protein n=1 Tax=Tritrichomonas musculus TaxID=1915356 RepID=A0ABR2ILD6_9EUKA
MDGNKYYKNYKDTFILGKTDPTSNDSDVIVFARCDIETAEIPPFVKIIGPFSFAGCHLQGIEFLGDSQLERIEKSAFYSSRLEEATLPSSLKSIGRKSFAFCKKLHSIDFDENSELQIIDEKAFFMSNIQYLEIPRMDGAMALKIYMNAKFCQMARII